MKWRVDVSRLVAHKEPHPLTRSTLPGKGRLAWALDCLETLVIHPIGGKLARGRGIVSSSEATLAFVSIALWD